MRQHSDQRDTTRIERRAERLAAIKDRDRLLDLVSDGLDDFKSDVAAAIETLKDVLCEHVDCGEVDLAIEAIGEEIDEALARFRKEVGL